MSPVLPDYSSDDDPPLVILGGERKEYRDVPGWKVTALVAAFIVLSFFYCMFIAYTSPVEDEQELLSTDREMPVEQVAADQ